MDKTHKNAKSPENIQRHQSSRKSYGSFYELLPNFLEAVQKPENDDILQRLQEITKSDKKIEWKMRTRYEGGGGMDKVPGRSLSLQQQDGKDDYWTRGDWRYRGDLLSSNSPRSDPTLMYAHPKDFDKNIKASIIREQCLRKGDLYGPDAIGAVSGYGVSRSSARGNYANFLGEDYYEDDYYANTHSKWGRNLRKNCDAVALDSESVASSVTSNSSRKQYGPVHGNKLHSDVGPATARYPANNSLSGGGKSEVASSETSNVVSTKKHKDVAKVVRKPAAQNMNVNNLFRVGKVKVEIGTPFLGCGDGSSGKASKHGKMRMPKKFKRKKSKTLRKKQRGNGNKRKSVSKHKSLDKRHKGPKIERMNMFNENTQVVENEQPKIRTVVLPYPQAKYKHTM